MFRCTLVGILSLIPALGFAAPKEEPARIGIQLRYLTVPEAEAAKLGLGDLAALKPGAVIDSSAVNALKNIRAQTLTRVVVPLHQPIVFDNTFSQFFLVGMKIHSVNDVLEFVPQNDSFKLGEETTVRASLSSDRKLIQLDVKFTSTSVETTKLLPITVPIAPTSGAGESINFTQYVQQPKFWKLKFDKKLSLSAPALTPSNALFNNRTSESALIVAGMRARKAREEYTVTPLSPTTVCLNRLLKNLGLTPGNELVLVQVTADLVDNAEAKLDR